MAEWREEGKAEIVPGVRQTDRQGYLTAKPWADSDKREDNQILIKKNHLGQKQLMICFPGTAASVKLSLHQTFLSLFSLIFHILSLLVFSILESM